MNWWDNPVIKDMQKNISLSPLTREEEDKQTIKKIKEYRESKTKKTKTPKKPKTPPSEVKKETIAKAKSTSKGTTIETEMRVKKDLSDKMKRALKKSVISSLENELKGAGLLSDSDSSSSDEEYYKPIKRRGRPKKKSI